MRFRSTLFDISEGKSELKRPLFQEEQLSVTGRKYVHEVLANRLGGLSLRRKSVARLTDRPDMTLDVYRGRKTTMQQQQPPSQVLYFQLLNCRGKKSS